MTVAQMSPTWSVFFLIASGFWSRFRWRPVVRSYIIRKTWYKKQSKPKLKPVSYLPQCSKKWINILLVISNPPKIPNLLFRKPLWEIQESKTLSLETKILSRLPFSSWVKLFTKPTKIRKKTDIAKAEIAPEIVGPKKTPL